MARRPRHPILTECSANDRFFSMNGEALYLNFSVKNFLPGQNSIVAIAYFILE
ncbi:MAG: hypothetical protein F6K48_07525 [Okeania sp. SIO3H1]|nr:hypothetical protein [Okeania sp. SIO3H1]